VIVVDSSALSKYFLKEEEWMEVKEHIERVSISLEMALKEACNALWKRVRRGEVEEEVALNMVKAIAEWEILKMADQRELMEEAFKIAVREELPLYDSLFIALAKMRGLPLLTSDERQAESASSEGVEVIKV
jgi:predicted nucleic acid-binding protein